MPIKKCKCGRPLNRFEEPSGRCGVCEKMQDTTQKITISGVVLLVLMILFGVFMLWPIS